MGWLLCLPGWPRAWVAAPPPPLLCLRVPEQCQASLPACCLQAVLRTARLPALQEAWESEEAVAAGVGGGGPGELLCPKPCMDASSE